jgi:hypothetical protein
MAKVELVPQVAQPPDGTVVFLIGMRINKWWLPHKWLPAFFAMVPMLTELYKNKERFGFLDAKTWVARTVIVVQYWRSLDELLDYARNAGAEHHPAWKRFNRVVGNNGAVGIYHEAYVLRPAEIHTVYRNMPLFGLGKATTSAPQRPLAFEPGAAA